MLKRLIWLACIFAISLAVRSQDPPLKNGSVNGVVDTVKLNQLVFKADRIGAATYLYDFLIAQPDPERSQLCSFWLDLAIFSAWSDSITESHSAFDHYSSCRTGQPDSPLQNSNRLLYRALQLSSTGSWNQAADSLIASIIIRPAYGTLNQLLLADSYGKLARLYKKTNDLTESFKNFNRSISLNRKLDREKVLAEDLSDFSSVLSLLDQSDPTADSVLFESLSIYKRIDSVRAIAQVYNEFGVLFNRRGKIEKSLEYFKITLQVKSRITDPKPHEFVAINSNIGHIYQYLAKPDSARYYFMKAIDYARISKDLDSVQYSARLATLYANIGASFGREGKTTEAIENFQKALNILDPTCSVTDLSTNPVTSKVNSPLLAEYTARKAYGYHERYIQTHDSADLFNGMNAFRVALDMMDILRSMYSFDSKPYLSSDTKVYYFYALDMALDLYKQTGEKKYLEEAFRLSGRNKSATLNEFLRTNMIYSNYKYLPADIQKSMNPGEALIDYTVVRNEMLNVDNMIVMVLTADTLYTYRDTLPKQFRKDIKAFIESITPFVNARIFEEFSRLSYLMYQYFFAPIENFRGIDKLIILPDEELGFLPFEAFVSDTIKPGGSDFRKLSYLNRRYQISYISSHEQLNQFRSKKVNGTKSTIYAFAPFASKGAKLDTLNLPTLENSSTEIHSMSKYFRTRAYMDESADELSLRRAFQRESVISLSTHGIMDPVHPMKSRLLLNPSEPDSCLSLFEMMSIKAISSLVILNACNTGTGKLQTGEGIMSMARGFQYAGVPSVITTLWPVDDQSSATIMKFFFRNLHDGMDQREALMTARNSYIDQSTKATGAPYFWAGQVLIGNPGSLTIRERTSPLTIVIPILLAALILTLLLAFYKKAR